MNRIILFGILLLMLLSSCNMTVDNGGGKTVSFADLPREVQDTIMYWTDNYAPILTNSDSLISIGEGMPAVISFDGRYTLDNVKFGPWITHMILRRSSDGRKYDLSYNVPSPIIVRNDTLIIPNDYNILISFDQNVKWSLYKLP